MTQPVSVIHPISKKDAWILAIRPKTLPAAASPVILGTGVAFLDGKFQPMPALAALLAAILLQIGANLSNDVFDFRKGADNPDRLGPTRVTQAGLLPPGEVIAGTWLVFGLAALLGLYLTWVSGWAIILVGICAILAAIAYTGGPFPLGYYGLGEVFVFLFFGPVAVCGTYYVQALQLAPLAAWSSISVGLLITAILVVNNLRDIHTDRAAGKHTMAVRLGVKGTRIEYLSCLIVAYLLPPLLSLVGVSPWWACLSLFSLPLAVALIRKIWRDTGRQLNPVLAGTGRLALLFSVLYALGLGIAAII